MNGRAKSKHMKELEELGRWLARKREGGDSNGSKK